MEEECPICIDPLSGNIATLGCCKKLMHVECLVKCMKQQLTCPMCRAAHESLRMVQDEHNPTLMVNINQHRNSQIFRDVFLGTVAMSILVVTVGVPYF